MHRRPIRTVLAALTATAVFAVLATAALAGQSIPSNNPTDFNALKKDGTAAVYAKAITPAMLAKPQTIAFGNPEVSGGGSITIGKRTNRGGMNGYQTITVKTLDTGLQLSGAASALSGGNLGTAKIASTKLGTTTYTVNLVYPGSEGTLPSLSLRFSTFQLLQ
jgi:hypothetical protein